LALLRDGPEWRPPQDAHRCRRLALELGYFGLDSPALDAALAPPPLAPHGYNLLTLFGGWHPSLREERSFLIDTASGGATVVDLDIGALESDFMETASFAALPDGRLLIWNLDSVDRPGRLRTHIYHLGEGLDADGRPRRFSEAGPAYSGLLGWRAFGANETLVSGTGLTVGGRAMCFGGAIHTSFDEEDTQEELLARTQWFDEGAGAWFEGPPMPQPVMSPLAADHGGCALAVLGGALWRYDPRAPAWASLAPLPARVPDGAVAVAVVGDRFLIIGGVSAAVRCFDVRAGRWEEAGAAGAPPPLPRSMTSFAALTVGSEVWCVGGEGVGPQGEGPQGGNTGIEIYGADTNAWRHVSLPDGWFFQNCTYGVNQVIAIPKLR
jgi:hypothetical protein